MHEYNGTNEVIFLRVVGLDGMNVY